MIKNPDIENLVRMLEYAADVEAAPTKDVVADVRKYIEDLERKTLND